MSIKHPLCTLTGVCQWLHWWIHLITNTWTLPGLNAGLSSWSLNTSHGIYWKCDTLDLLWSLLKSRFSLQDGILLGAVGAYDWNGAVLKETKHGKVVPPKSSYRDEFPEELKNHGAYLGNDMWNQRTCTALDSVLEFDASLVWWTKQQYTDYLCIVWALPLAVIQTEGGTIAKALQSVRAARV